MHCSARATACPCHHHHSHRRCPNPKRSKKHSQHCHLLRPSSSIQWCNWRPPHRCSSYHRSPLAPGPNRPKLFSRCHLIFAHRLADNYTQTALMGDRFQNPHAINDWILLEDSTLTWWNVGGKYVSKIWNDNKRTIRQITTDRRWHSITPFACSEMSLCVQTNYAIFTCIYVVHNPITVLYITHRQTHTYICFCLFIVIWKIAKIEFDDNYRNVYTIDEINRHLQLLQLCNQ